MADPLYELLTPYLSSSLPSRPPLHPKDTTTSKYLSRLTTLPLSALTTSEPSFLTQSTHSVNLALQSLSARSATALVASSTHLTSLRSTLPLLASSASSLRHEISALDTKAVAFSDRYSRAREENELLDRRKRALLLVRNVDRLSDILDLPTLLESAIVSSSSPSSSSSSLSAAAAAAGTGPSSTTTSSSYASALDLHSHIKRLHLLYPDSPLVTSIYAQTESAMRDMTSALILSLRSQNIKLAAGMRTIGWLRRVAPELDGSASVAPSVTVGGGGGNGGNISSEGSLGALFLVCRLGTLMGMISALAPLRDLADQETESRLRNDNNKNGSTSGGGGAASGTGTGTSERMKVVGGMVRDRDTSLWASGQQTERYLKRFIEIFREQSFAIVSMYRSIFPGAAAAGTTSASMMSSSGQEDLTVQLKSMGLKKSLVATTTAMRAMGHNNGGGGGGGGRGLQDENENGIQIEIGGEDPLNPIPSALATFPMHLVNLLVETLRAYLPNVRDKSSRESLLTQVLYCAGSLGRLGADFGLVLADVTGSVAGEGEEDSESEEDKEEEEEEWVAVMKKHRVLAGKLEKMASSGGS